MQSFELDKSDLLKIKQALEEGDDALKAFISEYHPSEIAILFESISQESRERIISILPAELACEIISEMDSEFHPEKLEQSIISMHSTIHLATVDSFATLSKKSTKIFVPWS